jgi:hypothetical protein
LEAFRAFSSCCHVNEAGGARLVFGLLFLLILLELLGFLPYSLKEFNSVVTDDFIEAVGATFIEYLKVSAVLQQ